MHIPIICLFLVILVGVYCDLQNGLEIDILCDHSGMTVRMVFDVPFQGVVFSKGFYKDSNCVYIEAKENIQLATFDIDTGRCGTVMKTANSTWKISNTLVVHTSSSTRTTVDSEVTVQCEISNNAKRLTWTIENHDDLLHEDDDDVIEAWMEVMFNSNLIEHPYLGDKVAVKIFVRDWGIHSDAFISNCIAHDESGEYSVNLLDNDGQPLKPNIFTSFNVSATSGGNANLIATANMTAFNLNNTDAMLLTCCVELCKSPCPRSLNRHLKVKRSVENNGQHEESYQNIADLIRRTMSTLHLGLEKDFARRNSNLNESVLSSSGMDSTRVEVDADATLSEIDSNTSQSNSISQFKFNVTVVVNAFSAFSQSKEQHSTQCFSKSKFNLITAILGVISICLFLTCICLTLHILNQKSKNKISKFLLYSYD